MEKSKLELIVGVFVLVGIVCLGYLSIKLGKLTSTKWMRCSIQPRD
jgi:hypothetical protein